MKDNIKALRKELGLTQYAFASAIGSAQNTIAGYETGRRKPSNQVISLICKTFNVNEEWLRTGKGEMFDKSNFQFIFDENGNCLDTRHGTKRYLDRLPLPDELHDCIDSLFTSHDTVGQIVISYILKYYCSLDENRKAAAKDFIYQFAETIELSKRFGPTHDTFLTDDSEDEPTPQG